MLPQPHVLMDSFPLSQTIGVEADKQPREDSSTRWSQSRGQSKSRNELQLCQSPSPLEPCIKTSPSRPIRHLSPSPSLLYSHPMDGWLNHSLSDLPLHTQQQESRNQMQRGGAPMHAQGCPPSPHTHTSGRVSTLNPSTEAGVI